MTHADYDVFDFRDIAALDDTAVLFRNWLSKSSSFFSDVWSEVSGYGAQVSLGQIRTESYGKVLDEVSKELYCCLGDVQDHLSTMWYASLEDLRLVVSEMLCLPNAKELTGNEMTPVEASLLKLFIDNFTQSLGDGWMGDGELAVTADRWARDPKKTRIFRSKDLVTKTSVQFELKVGNVEVHWLLPKQRLSDLLETTFDHRETREPVSPSPQLVGQLPVEVVSVLGRATVPMNELSRLAVGQTIMLDQRIDQPVLATVNDSPYFECWPGKIGKKQALEISECLNR